MTTQIANQNTVEQIVLLPRPKCEQPRRTCKYELEGKCHFTGVCKWKQNVALTGQQKPEEGQGIMRKRLSAFAGMVRRIVRRLTVWAWQERLDRLYTHQEVANWLSAYHGRYRGLTLTEWAERERAKGYQMRAEGNKMYAKGDKMYAEGCKKEAYE